ncbi:hypothetical protein Syun_013893 [Stephania yunnanensis]|uniref:Uncharacterized protein n=1 Tax=Stephania yunnanensis TaxID=152371 RepID=A0AAP0JI74_9MAGN
MESQAEALNQLTSDDLAGKSIGYIFHFLKHYLVGIVDEIDALSLDLASFLYLKVCSHRTIKEKHIIGLGDAS